MLKPKKEISSVITNWRASLKAPEVYAFIL